jgi:hypothetical protein
MSSRWRAQNFQAVPFLRLFVLWLGAILPTGTLWSGLLE